MLIKTTNDVDRLWASDYVSTVTSNRQIPEVGTFARGARLYSDIDLLYVLDGSLLVVLAEMKESGILIVEMKSQVKTAGLCNHCMLLIAPSRPQLTMSLEITYRKPSQSESFLNHFS